MSIYLPNLFNSKYTYMKCLAFPKNRKNLISNYIFAHRVENTEIYRTGGWRMNKKREKIINLMNTTIRLNKVWDNININSKEGLAYTLIVTYAPE